MERDTEEEGGGHGGSGSGRCSVLLDCCYAGRCCTARTAYHLKEEHERACPHAPCFCPEPGCGFAGAAAAELLDHLTGLHAWPSRTFRYWRPFDPLDHYRKSASGPLVAQPAGSQALRCENDGQLFLVNLRPAAAPPGLGLAVSLVCVPPYVRATRFGCTVSFSTSSPGLSGTCTLDDLQPLRLSDWPPTECTCVVPKPNVCYRDDEGWGEVVLATTIVCADPDHEDDDRDGMGFVATDEDDDDSC